jgi:hypothetical protein
MTFPASPGLQTRLLRRVLLLWVLGSSTLDKAHGGFRAAASLPAIHGTGNRLALIPAQAYRNRHALPLLPAQIRLADSSIAPLN